MRDVNTRDFLSSVLSDWPVQQHKALLTIVGLIDLRAKKYPMFGLIIVQVVSNGCELSQLLNCSLLELMICH